MICKEFGLKYEYLDGFSLYEIEKDGLTQLQEISKSGEEDLLGFLQRYFQCYRWVPDPPNEQDAVMIFLSELNTHLVDQTLAAFEVEEINFYNLRGYFNAVQEEDV